jgi:hypothetical protein
MIVFVYATLMLGKFNCVHQRSGLAVAGFMGVIMVIIFYTANSTLQLGTFELLKASDGMPSSLLSFLAKS